MQKTIAISLIALLFAFLPVAVLAEDEVPVLKMGMEGSEVKELQQLFNSLGYNIEVDGHFGQQTKTIVEAFQASFGLGSDGVVGQETWEVLQEAKPFLAYIVMPGDTLSRIAQSFDTTISAIKMANNLSSDRIYAGQEIIIPRSWMGGGDENPSTQTIRYRVVRGDTLSGISRRFGVPIEEIKARNKLTSDFIVEGQALEIPNPGSVSRSSAYGDFIWPARGRITSPFGYRTHPVRGTQQFHSGIDIALSHGTPVMATAGGLVTTSGWEGALGRTIIIDHGDGYCSLYAHNSQLVVRAGAYVAPGQVIALSGNSGVSTGPHLHFEIRKNGEPVNPLNYLPSR